MSVPQKRGAPRGNHPHPNPPLEGEGLSADRYEAVHRCLLAGWPTQVGMKTERGTYRSTRERSFAIFPGSSLAKSQPPWVLAGQILDLQKVYGMSCARIEPAWIEQQAAHLVRKTWRDAHWSRKRGAVVAFEQVTLFGLTLVEKRAVQFGPQDPAQAHGVFLREALARGEVDARADFVRANARVLAQAHELEAKRRRSGLVRSEDELAAFFAGKMPDDIHTAAALDAWYRKATPQEQAALHWSLDDVLSESPGIGAREFPAALDVGGHRLRLAYRFVPGDPADGVTLAIPLALVNAVPAARCEWLVPGLLPEKIAELIRALPKTLRRNFVPAPDFARAFAEAETLWRKAIAKDPNEPMLSYNLGLVARQQGKLDEAAKRFRDTIRRQPFHIEARLALASLHVEQNRFTAAERELAEIITNVEKAIEQPEGEKLKPLAARCRNMLGHVLYRLGNHSAAVQVLDMAMADAGDDGQRQAQILGDKALALSGLGEHEQAVAEAERALALMPQNPTINHVMGFVLLFAGRVSDAMAPIQNALSVDPTLMPALRTLAMAQNAAGQPDAAVDTLQRALRYNPHDRDSLLRLSILHIEGGRQAAAVDLLEPYLKAVPDDVRALNNLGLALHGLKRLDEARRALKRASRLSTDDPLVLTNLGSVLVDLGRAAEARSLHEHALRGLPDDARLLTNYGVCLAALGEKDRARETLDAALAANPNSAEALAARTGLDA